MTYDPYKIIDPTRPDMPLPIQGRSHSGRFTIKSQLSVLTEDHYPIESKYWSMYANGVRNTIDVMTNDPEFHFRIIPEETEFSWRMICEMYETARDVLRAGKHETVAIEAAHAFLRARQIETARKWIARKWIARERTGEPIGAWPADAETYSQALKDWFDENWERIPEIEL